MKLKYSLASAGLCAVGLLVCSLQSPIPSSSTIAASEETPAVTRQTDTPSKPVAKPARKRPIPDCRSVRISDVPHVKQKPDFCGEACAEMYLAKLGHKINQDDVFDQSGLDPLSGRGCYTGELRNALIRIGFDVGPVWNRVAAGRAETAFDGAFRALHADLAAGVPSIVCTHYDDKPDTTEHFRLILGYDRETDEVLYHEPAVAAGAYRRMAREEFLKLWPLKYDDDQWTLIRLRLKPRVIRDVHSTAKFTDADYAQHVMRLKRKVPEGFTTVLQSPFVVIGDESAETVRQRAAGTVKWAVDHLKRAYFTEDPDEILDIWLFRDKESYEKHTDEVFGDSPNTPFGYYSHVHRALIMNIDTGGGTLVHEIVHPFMASNFPQCPAWFNEGLASLYEQCGERRGRILGYTNWRLEGLQEAIEAEEIDADSGESGANSDEEPGESDESGDEEPEMKEPVEIPSFRTLCSTTTYEFYGADPGTNYAQARYLCYYLQQRGLLRKYYHEFRRNVRDDPGGYDTLKAVLGIRDDDHMEQFQDAWEAWILKLRFP